MWAAFMKSAKARLLVCWGLALVCAALGLVGGATLGARLVRAGRGDSLALYAVNAGQQAFVFILPSLLILQARPERWQRFLRRCCPLRLETVSFSLLLAVSGAVTAGILASLWVQWLQSAAGYQGSADPLPLPRTAGEWAVSVLVIAGAPALGEELLFRAVTQGGLRRLLPRGAVWIAAMIFAAVHLRLEALPTLLLVGAVLGKAYLRHGYWGSVLLHAFYNTVVLVLSACGLSLSPIMALACCAACIFSLIGLLKEGKSVETDGSGL